MSSTNSETNLIFFEIAEFTDKGKLREINEDSYIIYTPASIPLSGIKGMLAIADGYGGELEGEIISKVVTSEIYDFINQFNDPIDEVDLIKQLKHKIFQIHHNILEIRNKHLSYTKVYSSLACVILKDNKIIVANIGNSRVYLIRQGAIYLLSEDDTAFTKTKPHFNGYNDPIDNPFKIQLTQALGLEENIEPHIHSLEIYEGDTILLCSDGLSDYVNKEDIKTVIESNLSLQDSLDNLGKLALDKDSNDNITILAAKIYSDNYELNSKQNKLFDSKIIFMLLIIFIFFAIVLFFAPNIIAFLSNKINTVVSPSPTVSLPLEVSPTPSLDQLASPNQELPQQNKLTELSFNFDYDRTSKILKCNIYPSNIPIELNQVRYNSVPESIVIKKSKFKLDITWAKFKIENDTLNIEFEAPRYLYINSKRVSQDANTHYTVSLKDYENKKLRIGFYLNPSFPVIIPNLFDIL